MIETGIAASIDSRGAKQGAREFNQATGSMVSTSRTAGRSMRGSFDGVRRSIFSVRSAIIALGAAGTLRYIIQTASTFEQLRVALATAEGGADQASIAFDRVLEFAQETPFQVENITKAWIRLRNAGLEPTADRLTNIADLASGNTTDILDMTQAIASAMVGERESLKQFGITAKAEGDNLKFLFRGVTTSVRNDARSIAEYLFEIGRTKFAGAAAAQVKTLSGAMTNLKDTTSTLADEVGKHGLTDALGELTREIILSLKQTDGLAKALGEDLAGAVGLVTDAVKGGKENWETIRNVLVAIAGLTTLVGVARGIRGVGSALHFLGGTAIARFAMANPAMAMSLLAAGGLYALKDVQIGGKGVGPPTGAQSNEDRTKFVMGTGGRAESGGGGPLFVPDLSSEFDVAKRAKLRGDDIKAGAEAAAAAAKAAAEEARKAREAEAEAAAAAREWLESEAGLRERVESVTKRQYGALVEVSRETENMASIGEQAFARYGESVAGIANTSARAFAGVENALVDMAMKGKLAFADLVESAIAGLVRLQIQSALMGLGEYIFGAPGTGVQPRGHTSILMPGDVGTANQQVQMPSFQRSVSPPPQINITTPPGSEVSAIQQSREGGAPRTDILIESVSAKQVSTARNGGGLARLPGLNSASRSRNDLQG